MKPEYSFTFFFSYKKMTSSFYLYYILHLLLSTLSPPPPPRDQSIFSPLSVTFVRVFPFLSFISPVSSYLNRNLSISPQPTHAPTPARPAFHLPPHLSSVNFISYFLNLNFLYPPSVYSYLTLPLPSPATNLSIPAHNRS